MHLPIGESRLRFEGVADGIEPASAILTGLPDGVIEKNRDGALLSPSALVAAAVGKPVLLLRTNQKTGHLERLSGRILSDALGGVTFETAEGVEALRCSGLAESFSFESATDLSAHAALSVLVRSREPVTKMVTLSYLARGFDWAADYVATLSADGIKMDLGAWVTLANGNGTEFPSARTQVVAGRVNRESGEVEPIDRRRAHPGTLLAARLDQRFARTAADRPGDFAGSAEPRHCDGANGADGGRPCRGDGHRAAGGTGAAGRS